MPKSSIKINRSVFWPAIANRSVFAISKSQRFRDAKIALQNPKVAWMSYVMSSSLHDNEKSCREPKDCLRWRNAQAIRRLSHFSTLSRSLRNDNKIAGNRICTFKRWLPCRSPKKNSVLGRFSSRPPMPPSRMQNSCLLSSRCLWLSFAIICWLILIFKIMFQQTCP